MKKWSCCFLLLICLYSFCDAQNASSSVDGKIILKDASILDIHTGLFQQGSVVISGTQIEAIDFTGLMKMPKGAIIYELTGHYLIPGLIDAHVHIATDPSGSDNLEVTKQKLEYLLHNGVTAIRDMAGDTRYLSYLSRQATLNEIDAPDIFYSALMAGPTFFDDPRTHASARGATPGQSAWMKAVEANTNMARAISEAKGTGATGIKIYADLDATIIRQITEEAHLQGLEVWAHACVFPAKPIEIIHAKVDVLSHASLLAWEAVTEVPKSARERYSYLKNVQLEKEVIDSIIDALLKEDAILDATLAVYNQEGRDTTAYSFGKRVTKLAHQRRVKIGVGTDNLNLSDQPMQAPLLTEMLLMVEDIEMSPFEALRSATFINAEILGQEDKMGSIELDRLANIVVLKANPLEDIQNLEEIRIVVKNGKVYTP